MTYNLGSTDVKEMTVLELQEVLYEVSLGASETVMGKTSYKQWLMAKVSER